MSARWGVLSSVALLCCGAPIPMNKVDYKIANPPPGVSEIRSFRGEYFEIYGPQTKTQYSEVFWAPQPMALPSDIISRFDGKILAVTGYEIDIVRTQDAPNGTIISEQTVAPFEIYNHHYSGFMYSKGVGMVEEEQTSGHTPPKWKFDQNLDPPPGVAVIQVFSEGNGNEHRSSFHGYSTGFAQRIYSPVKWTNMPMIINTNKRLTDDKSPGPIGGPLPRQSLAPPNATYSGILECPCTTRKIKILSSYKVQSSATCVDTVVDTANECASAAKIMGLSPIGDKPVVDTPKLPYGCSAAFDTVTASWVVSFNNFSQSSAACGSMTDTQTMAGSTSISTAKVSVSLVLNSSLTLITMQGPADAWFGVGFNATKMADEPYTIVVDGLGNVEERKLADHAPGTLLPVTVSILSNTVKSDVRTIVLARPSSPEFSVSLEGIDIIAAGGASGVVNMSYHSTTKGSGRLTLSQAGSVGVCLCRDPSANTGSIDGQQFNPGVCAPFPTSELLTRHNSICNITTYEGGLYCCHGGSFLLDADQPVPEPADTWRLKYRFYFEDGDSVTSKNSFRVWWSTEAWNNEYDVPKSSAACDDPKTDPELCTYTLKSVFRGVDMLSLDNGCMVRDDPNTCGNVTRIQEQDGGLFQLVYAAGHCHAPACMSLELWDTDKQQLLCRNEPFYGTGNLTGYIAGIPPCLWGSAAEGLLPPPIISLNSNLTTIKRTNNTNGHWGVMGLWQMRAAYLS